MSGNVEIGPIMPDPKLPPDQDTWITPTREDHIEIPKPPDEDETEERREQPLSDTD